MISRISSNTWTKAPSRARTRKRRTNAIEALRPYSVLKVMRGRTYIWLWDPAHGCSHRWLQTAVNNPIQPQVYLPGIDPAFAVVVGQGCRISSLANHYQDQGCRKDPSILSISILKDYGLCRISNTSNNTKCMFVMWENKVASPARQNRLS